MQHLCNSYATLMQHLCNSYITLMQLLCNTYATLMQHLCNYYATLMQLLRNTYTTPHHARAVSLWVAFSLSVIGGLLGMALWMICQSESLYCLLSGLSLSYLSTCALISLTEFGRSRQRCSLEPHNFITMI